MPTEQTNALITQLAYHSLQYLTDSSTSVSESHSIFHNVSDPPLPIHNNQCCLHQPSECCDISTPIPKPSWINVLAFDRGGCTGLSTNLFIQQSSGLISKQQYQCNAVIEAAWKVSVVRGI